MMRIANGVPALLAVLLLVIVAQVAAASPVVIQMDSVGYVEGDPTPLPISISLTVDGAQADENAAPGDFLATGQGDVVFDLVIPPSSPVQLAGIPDLIATDLLAGTWTLDVDLIIGEILMPTQIQFTGLGLLPDQIVPDFSSVTSGVLTSATDVVLGGPLTGTVSIVSIVPEPSTALLLGLGLAGLASRRRDLRAWRRG